MTDMERQIRDELAAIGSRLAPLLGLDIADLVDERVSSRVGMIAHQVAGGDGDGVAAEVVIDLMAALWPDCDPPADWWRTPLGRAVGTSAGMDGSEAVSMSVAAAMLGVHPSRVTHLCSAGKLDRHPDGGVTRASVMARIVTSS